MVYKKSMDNFDMETEYFRSALKYYADEATGRGGQTSLSKDYGCTNQYINMILSGKNNPSYKVQQKFAKVLKTSRELLLEIGKRRLEGKLLPPPAPACNLCNIKDEATKRHQIVVEGFQDRELAIEVNELLVELEKLEGKTGLESIRKYISYQLNEAREKKGLSQPMNQKASGE